MPPSKSIQRRIAYDARNAQRHKAQLTEIIINTLLAQAAYQQADTILWYLHCRSEVLTYSFVVDELLKQDKKIVIPYCTKDNQGNNQLGLWHLQDMSELVEGTWSILEPPQARWGEEGKEVSPGLIDVVVVPGVAFDRQGGRLGNGAGYYDRLFTRLKSSSQLIAIAFDCQLVEEVYMQQHDIFMDTIITETGVFQGRGR